MCTTLLNRFYLNNCSCHIMLCVGHTSDELRYYHNNMNVACCYLILSTWKVYGCVTHMLYYQEKHPLFVTLCLCEQLSWAITVKPKIRRDTFRNSALSPTSPRVSKKTSPNITSNTGEAHGSKRTRLLVDCVQRYFSCDLNLESMSPFFLWTVVLHQHSLNSTTWTLHGHWTSMELSCTMQGWVQLFHNLSHIQHSQLTLFVPVGGCKALWEAGPRGLLKSINQICVNFSIRDKLSITTHNNLTHKNKNAFAVNALTLEVYSLYTVGSLENTSDAEFALLCFWF